MKLFNYLPEVVNIGNILRMKINDRTNMIETFDKIKQTDIFSWTDELKKSEDGLYIYNVNDIPIVYRKKDDKISIVSKYNKVHFIRLLLSSNILHNEEISQELRYKTLVYLLYESSFYNKYIKDEASIILSVCKDLSILIDTILKNELGRYRDNDTITSIAICRRILNEERFNHSIVSENNQTKFYNRK